MTTRKSEHQTAKRVDIFVAGACIGHQGPGAWASITRTPNGKRKRRGRDLNTTNNRAELRAAIGALEKLKNRSDVTVYPDSKYLIGGATQWCDCWKKNGWRTANSATVKNVDLWKRLLEASKKHIVEWRHVPRKSGHPEAERAEQLVRVEILGLLSSVIE